MLARLLLTCGLLAALPAAGSAGFTTYTSEAAFLAALQPGYYTEAFTGIPTGSFAGPQAFSGGGFGYQVSASPGTLLFGANVAGDRAISTNAFADTLIVSSFTGGPTAVGGYVFAANNGAVDPSAGLTVTVSDGVNSQTVNIPSPTGPSTYIGFVSDAGPITSFSFVRTPNLGVAPYLDDLTVGLAPVNAVPAPAGLILAGLAAPALGLVRRRKLA